MISSVMNMKEDLELKDPQIRFMELSAWVVGFVWLTIIVPGLIILSLPQDLKAGGVAVLIAFPLIEYLAISIGIGFGINPMLSFLLTVLPCIGIAMLVSGVLGFLGDSSVRAQKFLKKVQKKLGKYKGLKRYGVASNFIFIIILGIYIAPGISIFLGWSKVRYITFMVAGICFITFLIGIATMGIIELFFV